METSPAIQTEAPIADGEQGAAGESSGRRRRGRRGGRRRRRGGAEGVAVGENETHEQDDLHTGDVTAAHRSQPEFDFDDDEAPVSVVVPTTPSSVHQEEVPAMAVRREDDLQHSARSVADDADHLATLAGTPSASTGPGNVTPSAAEPVEPETESADNEADTGAAVPFVLEPAVMEPAATAAVGLPEVASTASASATTGGLFDAPQATSSSASVTEDPADAAASTIEQDADSAAVHAEDERSA
jgi:ribonuclease E